MFRLRVLSSLVACALAATFSVPQETHPAARTTPAFDQLKALAGHWETANPAGKKVEVSYEVISNGSVLMERIHPSGEPDMISMYSLEADRILVTHYCSMGNQPIMQTAAAPAANGKLDFTLLRLAGARSPDEGHMAALTVSIPDKNHLVMTWTFDDHGKMMSDTFSYTRKS